MVDEQHLRELAARLGVAIPDGGLPASKLMQQIYSAIDARCQAPLTLLREIITVLGVVLEAHEEYDADAAAMLDNRINDWRAQLAQLTELARRD